MTEDNEELLMESSMKKLFQIIGIALLSVIEYLAIGIFVGYGLCAGDGPNCNPYLFYAPVSIAFLINIFLLVKVIKGK